MRGHAQYRDRGKRRFRIERGALYARNNRVNSEGYGRGEYPKSVRCDHVSCWQLHLG